MASHFLILHTSCQVDPENASSDNKSNATSATGRGDDVQSTTPTRVVEEEDENWKMDSIPITCDLLFLPELPSHDEQPHMVELVQNHLNPCGLSNVLLLENLPWHDKEILLSLTSCALIYGNTRLPIDAVPSTFDFRFESQSTSNLFIALDVTEAQLQIVELVEQERRAQTMANLSQTADIDLSVSPSSTSRSKLEAVLEVQNTTVLKTKDIPLTPSNLGADHAFETTTECTNHHDGSEAAPISNRQECFLCPHKTTRLDQELETLRKVQSIMEQDAANLDRLLKVLSFVGVGLFLALVWSGYQVYRAKWDDCRNHNIRTSVECKMRIQSALSQFLLHPPPRTSRLSPPPRRDDPPPHRVVTPTKQQRESIEFCTPRIDNRSRSRMSVTPTRLDFSSDCLDTPSSPLKTKVVISDETSTVNIDSTNSPPTALSTHTNKNPFASYSKSTFVHHVPRQDELGRTTIFGGGKEHREDTKPNGLLNSSFGGKATGIAVNDKSTLSPCSKLAENWAAQKALRRSNRRRKPSKLNDPQKRLLVPTFSIPPVVDDLLQTPVLFPQPTVPLGPFVSSGKIASLDSRTTPSSHKPPQPKTNPLPKSQCNAPASVEIVQLTQQSSTTSTANSPSAKCPIPELVCSTPGSAESFVDDYW